MKTLYMKMNKSILYILISLLLMTTAVIIGGCKTAEAENPEPQPATNTFKKVHIDTNWREQPIVYPDWEESWCNEYNVELTSNEQRYLEKYFETVESYSLTNVPLEIDYPEEGEKGHPFADLVLDMYMNNSEDVAPHEIPGEETNWRIGEEVRSLLSIKSDKKFLDAMEERINKNYADYRYCWACRNVNTILLLHRINAGLDTPRAYRLAARSQVAFNYISSDCRLIKILLKEAIRKSKHPDGWDYLLLGNVLKYIPFHMNGTIHPHQEAAAAFLMAAKVTDDAIIKSLAYNNLFWIYTYNGFFEGIPLNKVQNCMGAIYSAYRSISNYNNAFPSPLKSWEEYKVSYMFYKIFIPLSEYTPAELFRIGAQDISYFDIDNPCAWIEKYDEIFDMINNDAGYYGDRYDLELGTKYLNEVKEQCY